MLFSVAMAAAFFDLKPNTFKKKEQYLFDASGDPIEINRTAGGNRRYSLN